MKATDFYLPYGNGLFLPMVITDVVALETFDPQLLSVELTLKARSAGPPVAHPEAGVPVREISR